MGLEDIAGIAPDWGAMTIKIAGILAFSLFLPISAYSYCRTRLVLKKQSVEKNIAWLDSELGKQSGWSGWQEFHEALGFPKFLLAAAFATVITVLGLCTLILNAELGLSRFPNSILSGVNFASPADLDANGALIPGTNLFHYQEGALMVFGMAFLGAYLWGLQYIMRRYFMNDLLPGVYFDLAVRMIFAAMLAVVIYHVAGGMIGLEGVFADPENEKDVAHAVGGSAPAIAFLIGFFPQWAFQWLRERFQLFSAPAKQGSKQLSLDLLEGMTMYKKIRFAEFGIENCLDLSNADIKELLIRSPYSPQQLLDWILQARLCQYFPGSVQELRAAGVRTVTDLKALVYTKNENRELDKQALANLAANSSLTEAILQHVAVAIEHDKALERLSTFERRLGERPEVESDVDGKEAEPERDQQPQAQVFRSAAVS